MSLPKALLHLGLGPCWSERDIIKLGIAGLDHAFVDRLIKKFFCQFICRFFHEISWSDFRGLERKSDFEEIRG